MVTRHSVGVCSKVTNFSVSLGCTPSTGLRAGVQVCTHQFQLDLGQPKNARPMRQRGVLPDSDSPPQLGLAPRLSINTAGDGNPIARQGIAIPIDSMMAASNLRSILAENHP